MDNTFLSRLEDADMQSYIVDVRSHAGETTIEVRKEHLFSVLQSLKNQFGFNYLADISTADHYSEMGRFELCYNLVNLTERKRLRVSCRIEEDQPEVDTAIPIWSGAEWLEREAFDMMGIRFRNHPDLRRIYMPEDFEYFPMRKEFPQLGIPGSIQLPEKD